MTEQLENNFMSKVNIKIETNSRGYNTVVHIYNGVTEDEINDTISKAIYAHKELHKQLAKLHEG